jgi:hypothetical protein
MFKLRNNERLFEIFALQPIRQNDDLAARCRYQMRYDFAFRRRREKSRAMSVETAEAGQQRNIPAIGFYHTTVRPNIAAVTHRYDSMTLARRAP